MRCMRAGAREFLTLPFDAQLMAEALVRPGAPPGGARREEGERQAAGFMGAKGGAGVTTLACNFAVALARSRTRRRC